MKSLLFLGLATIAMPASALAAESISGTWKTDVSTVQIVEKPTKRMLKDGIYRCDSCVPAWSVKADGQYHAVKGQPYWDEAAVKEVDARTVKQMYRKAGKQTGEGLLAVAADGKSLTSSWTDMTGAKTAEYKGTQTRIGAAPKGAHSVSGEWQAIKATNASDTGLIAMISEKGDTFDYKTPTGYGYTAKLGGPPVAIKTDSAGTMAAIKKTGPRTWVETDTRGGKVVGIATMEVSTDGKTLIGTYDDKVQGSTTKYAMRRQ